MSNKHSRRFSLVLFCFFSYLSSLTFSLPEIYRIVSQRQMPDPMGPTGNGGTGPTVGPIRLPPTNPVTDSKSNTSCCS